MTPRAAHRYAWAIEQLRTAPPEQRRKVAAALREVWSDEVIPVLVLAMRDSDAEVVRLVTDPYFPPLHPKMGRIPVRYFLKLLDHPDYRIPSQAMEWIECSRDSNLTDEFARRMEADRGWQRLPLAIALGNMGDRRALPELLLHKNSQAAIYALGRIKDPRATQRLIELLQDENDDVKWQAAGGLELQKDPRAAPALVAALKGRGLGVCEYAARALGELGGAEAVQGLLGVLRAQEVNPNVRAAAAASLGKCADPSAIPELMAGRPPGYYPYRDTSAVDALAKLAPLAPQVFIAGLKSADPNVRRLCAWALGKAGIREATAPLVEMLRGDESILGDDACTAADALALLKDPRAVDALIAKLKGSRNARWWSAYALGQIGDQRAIDPLIDTMLTDHENGCTPGVANQQYFRALGAMGKPAARALLRRVEKDPNSNRSELVQALGWAKDPSAVPVLIRGLRGGAHEYVKREAAISLGKIGDPGAVDALAPLLDNRDWFFRRDVANALAAIGGEKAAGAIIRSFEKNPHEWLCPAMGGCKDPRAVPVLRKFAERASWPLPGYSAEKALGNLLCDLGGKDSVAIMLEVLERNPRSPVRESLAQLGVPTK